MRRSRPKAVADAWGLTSGYDDAHGAWQATSPETRRALLAAMGVDDGARPPAGPAPVRVLRPGAAVPLRGPVELTLEDGTVLPVTGRLPPDLPFGYHSLRRARDGRTIRCIVSPMQCFLPDDLRAWGWAVQLYALRSGQSWGMGDLEDLRRLGRWSARTLGAGLLLVNPLGAASPGLPQQPSPYYPSSRRFLNPLYLRVEEVPGARDAGTDLEELAAAGRALNGARRIDRDAVFRLKMAALDRLWSRWGGAAELDRYRTERGESLVQFATYCTLAERYGGGWPRWPEEYRSPGSPAVRRLAASGDGRVRFHEWLQWLLDRQLAAAAAELPLMQDLPVGVDPDGADAWAWQDVLAQRVSIGAPPDVFNARGQDWGLPPLVPHRLRAAGYAPFIETIRAALRWAGGLRIDHVMGLFRLFWVPWGRSPAEGAYVRYRADDLLAIVALESHRARAVIVGEDLGTVEEAVRRELSARRVLSYRLLWFERDPPRRYPRLALAAVTTHDLPTIAGLWTGADLEDQRAAGLTPSEDALVTLRAELGAATGLAADAPVAEVVRRAHLILAEAPSVLVAATLEDALAVEERPNLPGTTTERPNWSLALPGPIEAIEEHPLVRSVAEALAGRHAGGSPEP